MLTCPALFSGVAMTMIVKFLSWRMPARAYAKRLAMANLTNLMFSPNDPAPHQRHAEFPHPVTLTQNIAPGGEFQMMVQVGG